MKPDCLSDRDLLLLHYGERPDGASPAAAAAHLADCAACRAHGAKLAADLARIPAPADPDPAVATRIAARVDERLRTRHRGLPWAGAVAAGAVALAMAVVVWLPAGRQLPADSPQMAGNGPSAIEQPFVGPPRPLLQATLDLELLDKLDLLEELETLRAIEGV